MAHEVNGFVLTENDVHLSSFPLARLYEFEVVLLFLLIGGSIGFQHPDSRYFIDAGKKIFALIFLKK